MKGRSITKTEENKKFAILRENFEFFAEKFLKIQTETAEIVPFKLRPVQQVLERIIEDIKSKKRPVRLVILKARREGVSTWFAGRIFQKVLTGKNIKCAFVTHADATTAEMFGWLKRFYAYLPPALQPPLLNSNAIELVFNDKSGKGLDNKILVGTAGKKNFGSGIGFQYLHLSEVAKWPEGNSESVLNSLMQTVPDMEGTEIVFESTAMGVGGVFYDQYFSSRYVYNVYRDNDGKIQFKVEINDKADQSNNYSSIFVPWWVDSRYSIAPYAGFQITPDEMKLKELYSLSDSQLQWRRSTITDKCSNKITVFQQEYPSNAQEAFVSTGFNFFDVTKLQVYIHGCKDVYKMHEVNIASGKIISNINGNLKIFQDRLYSASYVIGADVAEGLRTRDFSCAQVINHRTGEQVAEWHGRLDPPSFAKVLKYLGIYYNDAWVVPERNNHGHTVCDYLSKDGYKNLYVETKDDPPHGIVQKYGWLTTEGSRHQILDYLQESVLLNTHKINSKALLEEMMFFVKTANGKFQAQHGHFDDRIFAVAIARFVKRDLPYSHKIRNYHMSEGVSPATWA